MISVALTLSLALLASPTINTGTALAMTADEACVPVLTGEMVWPTGPNKLADEAALRAKLGI